VAGINIMKCFALRIKRPIRITGSFFPDVDWEEFELLEEAEARAKTLRRMGASVDIYRLL
jgi:hypothetical protein